MKIIKADKAEIGTSVIGALILGIGLGSLFSSYLINYAYIIILAGIVLHALGMYQIHKRESLLSNEQFSLSSILYWICWAILIALFLYIIIAKYL